MTSKRLAITIGLFLLLFLPVIALSFMAYTVFHQVILVVGGMVHAWVAYYIGYLLSERERLGRDVFLQSYELKKVKEALESCQGVDNKNSVYNERFLGMRLTEECERSRRYQRPFSCLLVSIDNFRQIVERSGAVKSSVVVQEVAEFLKENTRSVDIVIRQGEDRFVAVLPETRANQARIAAERIRYAIEKNTFRIEDEAIKITVSISVICFDQTIHRGKEDLLSSLEKTLAVGRKSGPNRVSGSSDL